MLIRHWLGKFTAVAVCAFVFLMVTKRLSDCSDDRILPNVRPVDPSCASFPDTSNILVVVKTGATESYARIPTQLFTVLRCLPDFLLFSDLEQNIAGYHIHDSLDTVIPQVKENNPDFDLYWQQQTCPIDQDSCVKGTIGHDRQSLLGWKLDKYKNVHIAEKTYCLRPGYDWYLFIDADTYVLWYNLVQWLHKLKNPWHEKHYIGSATFINDFPFAHGGSGYILSHATLQDLVENHPSIANNYDMRAKDSCCGDHVLGLALNETIDVGVTFAWPTINGEKPYTIPYGPREWCQPLEFEKRFFESSDLPRPALRIKDIYHAFVEPKLSVQRDDWDNLSGDVLYLDPDVKHEKWQEDRARKLNQQMRVPPVEMDAHKSFYHCRRLCDTVPSCFQFSFHDGICAYSNSFALGKPVEKKDKEEQRWVSGWNVNRIREWVAKQGDCKEPVWPHV
ncbi:glycosyltransferase family 31 protein [Hypoxylon sp. FL1150]|nr:glycosyltransferase family 31 protein [Hypoxylon sp. FL1150]